MLNSISVIIPVRNEEKYIAACLDSVLSQDCREDIREIIVVDGCSTDGTLAIIRAYQAHCPILKLIQNPARIVPVGMNLAYPLTSGDIIVRVDGHCIIQPDYISQCRAHIQNDSMDAVGGPMETIGETWLSTAIAIAMSSRFGVGGSAFRTTSGRTMLADTVPFPAYTRKAMDTAGGYDEELVRNQDDEYNYRLRELGFKIQLSAKVRSRYYSRGNFRSLWRQYYQYGYWKVRVFQKHPRQMSLRQFAPPVFVVLLVIFGLLAFFTMPGRYLFAALAGVYLSANLAAALIAAASKGWRYLPALPPAYAILHVSYGLGFLTGLARFAGRWKDKTGRVPGRKSPSQGQAAEGLRS